MLQALQRAVLMVLLLVLPAGLLVGQQRTRPGQRQRPPAHWVDPDRSTPNGTAYRTFFSQTIEGEVSYLISLPPGYADTPSRRYPVVYWLHGLGGDQRGGAGSFLPHLVAATEAGIAPPMIAVFVNGMRDSFYHDAPGGQQSVQSVLIHDLLPHIDTTYRTVADRRGRAVEGYSMGGFGGAYLGFKYPELFGAVSIMAGALLDAESMATRHPDLMTKIYGDDHAGYEAAHPFRWADTHADRIRDRTFVRICVGSRDPLRPRNEALHAILTRLRIDHPFELVEDVGHNGRLFYETRGAEGFAFYGRAFGDAATPYRR